MSRLPLVPLFAAVALVLTLSACAGTRQRPASVDPAVAERARVAGLTAQEARDEAAREVAALALRAPLMGYPILVPSDLVPSERGAFVLDGATVDDDGDEVYYALRYRRPDGVCFAVAGGGEENAAAGRLGGGPRDSVHVEVRALHAVAVVDRVHAPSDEEGAPMPGDLVSQPIDADGLAVTFSSTSDEGADCRPVTLPEAAALVAGLRPLDPADDLEGAYSPLDLSRVPGPREGEDSETLARLAFAPPGSGGATVETVRRTERRAVVLVTRRGLGGDAVRDEEVRAVFVYGDEGTWRLVSAGERFRCQPGRGHQDWSPEPCE